MLMLRVAACSLVLWSGCVAWAFQSDSCKIDSAALRACEGGNKLAPKHYPASVVFLPNRVENYASLKGILRDLDADRSATRVALGAGVYDKIRGDAMGDPEMERLLRTYTINEGKNENWAVSDFPASGSYVRDVVVYTVNPANGAIQIQQGRSKPENVIREGASALCGRPVERVWAKATAVNSDRGGNILALPGGFCLTAKGATPDYVKSVCGPNAKHLALEPDFSKIKHVDEIVNVVPRPGVPPPCDFAIVMASPRKMKEVLRKNPKGSFYTEDGLALAQRAERSCSNGSCDNPITSLCGDLQNMIELTRIQNELQKFEASGRKGSSGSGTRGFGARPLAPRRAPAGVIGLDGGDWRTEFEQDERSRFPFLFPAETSAPVDCSRFRNEDVLKILEVDAQKALDDLRSWVDENEKSWIQENNEKHKDKFATNEDHDVSRRSKLSDLRVKLSMIGRFGKKADELQARQDRNWEKIKAALPKECRSDDLRVDLPSIPGGGGSLNPNPTNLQIVGKTALYPQQFNPAVAQEIESSLKALGLRPQAVTSFKEHVNGGNIHCITNEIRLCRP